MIRGRAFVAGRAALLAAPGSAKAQSASRRAKIDVLDVLSPGSVRRHLWDRAQWYSPLHVGGLS